MPDPQHLAPRRRRAHRYQPPAEAQRLQAYIVDIRRTLRRECAEFDDNDWSDELHLSDVIEKHLARAAWDRIRELEAQLARHAEANQ